MSVTSVRDTLRARDRTDVAAVLLNSASAPPVTPKLRVGVLLERATITIWIRHILEYIAGSRHSELALIVQNCEQFKTGEQGKQGKLAFPQLWHWARNWLKKPKMKSGNTENRWMETFKAVSIAASDNYKANRSIIEQIKAANLDVILHLGRGSPPTQIIGCVNHAVWSFEVEPGDAGFLQPFLCRKYSGRGTSEVILRALNVDSDRVLYRGRFLNESSWPPRNRRSDYRRRGRILIRALSELHAGKLEPRSIVDSESNALASDAVTAPSGAIFKARVLVEWWLDCAWKMLLGIWSREQWFVAYRYKLEATADDNRTKQLTVLEPPRQYNYADPFLFERNQRRYLFFEAWHATSKGEIWCVEIDESGNPSEATAVLSRPYHLSFPFVFEWEGEIYLLPETRQNKTIEVYRASEFPFRWDAERVLMNDVSAVDTIIAQYAEKLWLFTAGIGGPEFRLNELSLFCADTLFGSWKPHPKNPVVCDIRRARPAGGLFFHGADLIRPAQDCSKAYGQAVTLNRITALSESDYEEKIVATIMPDWMPNIHRVHTFNQTGKFEVFDACRTVSRYHFRSPFHARVQPRFYTKSQSIDIHNWPTAES